MKNIYLSLVLLFVANLTFASSSDLFKLDYNQVKQDFAQLNQLANKVKTENLTYNDLMVTDANMINNMALSKVPSLSLPDGILGIPSFFWGCILGPIGVIISYFATGKNKKEVKHALLGCLLEIYVIIGATAPIWIFIIGGGF